MNNKFEIAKVETDSIGEEMGVCAGDFLVNINGKNIVDIFDYRYLINEEELEVTIEKKDGEQWILEVSKDFNEDLGFVFEEGLMSEAKSCKNKCIFCFIDQLPNGMRETLYFKDDDSRLSFLQGNYVTLTNMSDEDIERIIYYHLSPINISVHSTDLQLREFMLKNPNSSKLMEKLNRFRDAGIEMNFQIVLCKDINDGHYLEKSIVDLAEFMPVAKSLSIVPVGISKYRVKNNLFKLKPFEKNDCVEIVEKIKQFQIKLKKEYGSSFVFCSDEFYLTGEVDFPSYDEYEDFPQIENGVGMIPLMKYEFETYLSTLGSMNVNKTVSIATGKAAKGFIDSLVKKLEKKAIGLKINVFEITNNFFGNEITVSGLLTGEDIVNQLKNRDLGQVLYLPSNLLKAGETVLLDNMDLEEMEKILKIKIDIIDTNGVDFVNKICHII